MSKFLTFHSMIATDDSRFYYAAIATLVDSKGDVANQWIFKRQGRKYTEGKFYHIMNSGDFTIYKNPLDFIDAVCTHKNLTNYSIEKSPKTSRSEIKEGYKFTRSQFVDLVQAHEDSYMSKAKATCIGGTIGSTIIKMYNIITNSGFNWSKDDANDALSYMTSSTGAKRWVGDSIIDGALSREVERLRNEFETLHGDYTDKYGKLNTADPEPLPEPEPKSVTYKSWGEWS